MRAYTYACALFVHICMCAHFCLKQRGSPGHLAHLECWRSCDGKEVNCLCDLAYARSVSIVVSYPAFEYQTLRVFRRPLDPIVTADTLPKPNSTDKESAQGIGVSRRIDRRPIPTKRSTSNRCIGTRNSTTMSKEAT